MATITIAPISENKDASQHGLTLVASPTETLPSDLRTDQPFGDYKAIAASPERLHQVAVHIAQIRELGNPFEQADADTLARKVAAGIIGNTKDIPLEHILWHPDTLYVFDPKFRDPVMHQYAEDIRTIIKQGHQSMALSKLLGGAGAGAAKAGGEFANDGAGHAAHLLGMQPDASPARDLLEGVEKAQIAGENLFAQLQGDEPARTAMLDKWDEIAALPSAARAAIMKDVDEKRVKIAEALFDNQALQLGKMYAEGATKAGATVAATALGGAGFGTTARVMGPIEQAIHDEKELTNTLNAMKPNHKDYAATYELRDKNGDKIKRLIKDKHLTILTAEDNAATYGDMLSLMRGGGFDSAKLDQLTKLSQYSLPVVARSLDQVSLFVVTLQGGRKELYWKNAGEYFDKAEKITVDRALNAMDAYSHDYPARTRQVREALQREFGLPVDKPGPQSRIDNVSGQADVAAAEISQEGGVSV